MTTTGLVIDHLNLKLNYIEAGEGQVIVSLYGDDGDGIKKTASYFYGKSLFLCTVEIFDCDKFYKSLKRSLGLISLLTK